MCCTDLPYVFPRGLVSPITGIFIAMVQSIFSLFVCIVVVEVCCVQRIRVMQGSVFHNDHGGRRTYPERHPILIKSREPLRPHQILFVFHNEEWTRANLFETLSAQRSTVILTRLQEIRKARRNLVVRGQAEFCNSHRTYTISQRNSSKPSRQSLTTSAARINPTHATLECSTGDGGASHEHVLGLCTDSDVPKQVS